eukprot:gene23848-biopygen9672
MHTRENRDNSIELRVEVHQLRSELSWCSLSGLRDGSHILMVQPRKRGKQPRLICTSHWESITLKNTLPGFALSTFALAHSTFESTLGALSK